MDEYDYEEQILKEFNEAVDKFKSKHGMENTSMCRLLMTKVNSYLDDIDTGN